MRLIKKWKQTEIDKKLRQEQKLQVLGTLASVISHDLNNQLSATLANVGLSLDKLDPGHPASGGLREAQQATVRCVEMIRGLLGLSRSLKPELKPVGLDVLIKGTERVLRRVIPPSLSTRFEQNGQVPAVMADALQLQQVILNLAVNASNGMPEQSLLEIKASNGGRYAAIYVSVLRLGKTLKNPTRHFEPFSVAKASRDGTVFGLARDVEIIQAHGGSIGLARDRAGTSFRVTLPVADGQKSPVKGEDLAAVRSARAGK